jgi:hypothetical protein
MSGPIAFGADTVELSKEITASFASKVRRDGEFPDQCLEENLGSERLRGEIESCGMAQGY